MTSSTKQEVHDVSQRRQTHLGLSQYFDGEVITAMHRASSRTKSVSKKLWAETKEMPWRYVKSQHYIHRCNILCELL